MFHPVKPPLPGATPQYTTTSRLSPHQRQTDSSFARTAEPDNINFPAHYVQSNPAQEPIKVIEAWKLGFHLGNVIKYIARSGRKGPALDDLLKARWYLDREITRMESVQPDQADMFHGFSRGGGGS